MTIYRLSIARQRTWKRQNILSPSRIRNDDVLEKMIFSRFLSDRLSADTAQKNRSMFIADQFSHWIWREVNQIKESRHRRPRHIATLCSFVQRIYIHLQLHIKYCKKKNNAHVSRSRRRKKLPARNIASCTMLTKREHCCREVFSWSEEKKEKKMLDALIYEEAYCIESNTTGTRQSAVVSKDIVRAKIRCWMKLSCSVILSNNAQAKSISVLFISVEIDSSTTARFVLEKIRRLLESVWITSSQSLATSSSDLQSFHVYWDVWFLTITIAKNHVDMWLFDKAMKKRHKTKNECNHHRSTQRCRSSFEVCKRSYSYS